MYLSVFVGEEAEAAIASEKRIFDENGNYITGYRHPQDTNCCIVPSCIDYNECYESIKCGYACSQGPYAPIDYGFTPGFSLKEQFTKNDCHFGFCKDYVFSCKHCPDPKLSDFNIYTVRRDCRECYYKNA